MVSLSNKSISICLKQASQKPVASSSDHNDNQYQKRERHIQEHKWGVIAGKIATTKSMEGAVMETYVITDIFNRVSVVQPVQEKFEQPPIHESRRSARYIFSPWPYI